MTSDYLNRTRSIEELDAYFEKERYRAAEVADLSFRKEVATAIRTVSDINEVANARIYSNMEVASAKISSSAEVHSTSLLATAELFRHRLQNSGNFVPTNSENRNSMIAEVARTATKEIKSTAAAAIETIKSEAKDAVAQIASNANLAIAEINSISNKVISNIEDNAKLGREKLEKQKEFARVPESVIASAQIASAKILDSAANSSRELQVFVQKSVLVTNEAAAEACRRISVVTEKATERIISTRDRVLLKLKVLFEPGSGKTKS